VGSRIPQSLWRLAVRLVSKHGLSRTAGALRIDYYSLKKQTEAAAQDKPSSGPAFVELPAPGVVGKQCLFELTNRAGGRIRLQLWGYDANEIETVAGTLWTAE
jgi:hypothetical protein